MDYAEIVKVALGYADRQDKEVSDNMDNFLRVVESRVNRRLKINEQSTRSRILTSIDEEYYGLPSDFSAVRDIELQNVEGATTATLALVNPEQMNQHKIAGTKTMIYSIIANQLQIHPKQDGKVIEIVYYQKVPELGTLSATNWLSINYPDCYIFGLLVEISAFVKDATTADLWDARFNNVIEETIVNDQKNRWSGTPLQTRIG